LLAEYRRATGTVRSGGYGKVKILYPTMSLIQQMETNDTETDEDSSDESSDGDYSTDVGIEEVRTLSFRCLISFVSLYIARHFPSELFRRRMGGGDESGILLGQYAQNIASGRQHA
jgi:hypothetical protein